MGAVFVPLTLIATTGLKNEDQGLASGLFNTSQQIGGALGLAILSTIAASRAAAASGTDAETLVDGLPLGVRRSGGLRARRARAAARAAAEGGRRADLDRGGAGADRMTAPRSAPTPSETSSACSRRRPRRSPSAAPDVSVDEIARRAGVGHATVFRRFPTKDSLIAAVVCKRVDALVVARRGRRSSGPTPARRSASSCGTRARRSRPTARSGTGSAASSRTWPSRRPSCSRSCSS